MGVKSVSLAFNSFPTANTIQFSLRWVNSGDLLLYIHRANRCPIYYGFILVRTYTTWINDGFSPKNAVVKATWKNGKYIVKWILTPMHRSNTTIHYSGLFFDYSMCQIHAFWAVYQRAYFVDHLLVKIYCKLLIFAIRPRVSNRSG